MSNESKERPRFSLKWRGLNTQIFLIAVLPISLLLLVVTFGSLSVHQDAMRTLVGERDKRTARSAASAIREQLNHRAAAIHGLALRVEDNPSLDEILESADFLLPDFDIGMAFYSQAGELITARGDLNLWDSLEPAISAEIANYLNESLTQPYFSEPYQHPIYDNYLVVVMSRNSLQDPVATGAFSVTNLARQTLAGTTTYEDETTIFLVDDRGQLLFHVGELVLSGNPLEHPGVGEALHGESGTTYLLVDGSEHVVAFNPVPPTGWALVIEEPWDSVASPLLRYTEAGPLVLVPIVIFSLIALWFSARQIIQPLRELEAQSAALAWGDFEAVKEPVGGIDEIISLQRTLIDLAEKVQNAQQSLRSYIGTITEGQEEERRRLARELHDETLQSLIALNQRVQLIRRSTKDENAVIGLDELQELIGHAMQELRRLTRALRPLYLEDLGLVASLDMLSRETSEETGIPIEFYRQGTEKRLPDHTEIAIFRIVQEALSNIARHADAGSAAISLAHQHDDVLLTITDDGKGFIVADNPSELSHEGHFGLLGIYERAELIGANFKIHSEVGQGSQLIIKIPIKNIGEYGN